MLQCCPQYIFFISTDWYWWVQQRHTYCVYDSPVSCVYTLQSITSVAEDLKPIVAQLLTMKPVLRNHMSWRTVYSWQKVPHLNVIEHVTKDNLSWETIFFWPAGWSFKTGSIVSAWLPGYNVSTCGHIAFLNVRGEKQWFAWVLSRLAHILISVWENCTQGTPNYMGSKGICVRLTGNNNSIQRWYAMSVAPNYQE